MRVAIVENTALSHRGQVGGALHEVAVRIEVQPLATDDPVMGQVPACFPILEWHSDTFTLPQGVVQPATTATAPVQSFRAYLATYGTQFHFEASRAMVADWNATFPDAVERMAPRWLSRHASLTETLGRASDAHGLALARAWVALV